MNRIITFFLILVIFGGAIHFDELLKAPVLFRHYSKHKTQHPNDSPISFLYKHYILNQNAESENDGASDSQMPIKSNQCIQFTILMVS